MAKQSYVSLGETTHPRHRSIARQRAELLDDIAGPSGCYAASVCAAARSSLPVPWIWLLCFFLVPFVIVLGISFAETRFVGMPPYAPLFEWVDSKFVQVRFNVDNFVSLTRDNVCTSKPS